MSLPWCTCIRCKSVREELKEDYLFFFFLFYFYFFPTRFFKLADTFLFFVRWPGNEFLHSLKCCQQKHTKQKNKKNGCCSVCFFGARISARTQCGGNRTAAAQSQQRIVFWWWFRNEIFWFFWFETEKCRGLLRGEKKRKRRLLFSPVLSSLPLLGWWDFSSLPPVLITVCTPAVDGCGRFSREMLFCSSFFRLLFFYFPSAGRLWMCKWQGVGPCSAVYPSPFHTHTHTRVLLSCYT